MSNEATTTADNEDGPSALLREALDSFRWIVRGNIVVPTGNPFLSSSSSTHDNDSPEKDEQADDSNNNKEKTHKNSIAVGPGLVIQVDHILAVDASGKIVRLEPADSFLEQYSTSSDDNNDNIMKHVLLDDIQNHPGYITMDPQLEFLCPGMIDLHIHAPQYAFLGTATDRPLMGPHGWLETYTFPTERSFGTDLEMTQIVYNDLVDKTLTLGTTTAVYFATLDVAPAKVLVDIALEKGQRALIGNVCMDRNAPESYCHSTSQNLQDTVEVISYIQNHPQQPTAKQSSSPQPQHQIHNKTKSPLVLPLITPRFIPTCTPELLQGLGEIAQKYDCHVTSHISESIDEVEFSRQCDVEDHPPPITNGGTGRSDAEIFHSHGLLTNKCIMAHGVYLSAKDLDLMQSQGSAIAHCPLSNFFFAGACLSCRKYLSERPNLKIGLGTDMAGGYSPSMWNSSRMAVVASLALQQQQQSNSPLLLSSNHPNVTFENNAMDYRHAFYLATLGGAKALGLDDTIGTFCVGMEFDAMILSAAPSSSIPNVYTRDRLEDVFQKLCTNGDDRNVTQVFVQGRRVVNKRKKQT